MSPDADDDAKRPDRRRPLRLADPALPAAAHLVGPGAVDVLRPPIEASGGVVRSARPEAVQYRPGSDVVVRYAVEVEQPDGARAVETIVAASTLHGDYPGAVMVTADHGGEVLRAAVWKWPFDPFVPGLGDAVTPSRVARILGFDTAAGVRPEVVAYRPTERVVVRVSHPPLDVGGTHAVTTSYVKAVRTGRDAALVERHRTMRASGVPAPSVRLHLAGSSALVLDELPGPTLRDLVKDDRLDVAPTPSELDDLALALAGVCLGDVEPAPRLLRDGALHARMLAAVLDSESERLGRLAEVFESADADELDEPSVTVHGDLHEAQLVVDQGGRITGLLDIDDAGPGNPLSDRANLIGRLRYRQAIDAHSGIGAGAYADRLRAHASPSAGDDLDLRTAAAVVGLATGPFRAQRRGWRNDVTELVTAAERLVMPRA